MSVERTGLESCRVGGRRLTPSGAVLILALLGHHPFFLVTEPLGDVIRVGEELGTHGLAQSWALWGPSGCATPCGRPSGIRKLAASAPFLIADILGGHFPFF